MIGVSFYPFSNLWGRTPLKGVQPLTEGFWKPWWLRSKIPEKKDSRGELPSIMWERTVESPKG